MRSESELGQCGSIVLQGKADHMIDWSLIIYRVQLQQLLSQLQDASPYSLFSFSTRSRTPYEPQPATTTPPTQTIVTRPTHVHRHPSKSGASCSNTLTYLPGHTEEILLVDSLALTEQKNGLQRQVRSELTIPIKPRYKQPRYKQYTQYKQSTRLSPIISYTKLQKTSIQGTFIILLSLPYKIAYNKVQWVQLTIKKFTIIKKLRVISQILIQLYPYYLTITKIYVIIQILLLYFTISLYTNESY